MARRILYLLIEEQDRELRSRALIAAIAADRGFEVVLAPQWTVWQNWERLPPGLVLFKGNNAAQSVRMRQAKRFGHAVASIEEEALGVSDRHQLLRSYAPDIAEVCDAFLVHGRFQRDCIATRYPAVGTRVRITGNPRIDLLEPRFADGRQARVDGLRGRIGDFILVNTNFATINPRDDDALGCFDMCERVGLIDARVPGDLDDFFTWCAWERGNLAAVCRLLAGLAARSPWPVVLRPHPTEDLDPWRQALEHVAGVSVIREGDHLAWTASARLLIHSGCTTGLEALLLGTPALSLVVDDNPWHGRYLSNLVNLTVPDVETAMRLTLDLAAGRDRISPGRAAFLAALQEHLVARPGHLAAAAVVDALTEMPSPPAPCCPATALERARPVPPGAGKIEAEVFTAATLATMIDGFRASLGLADGVEVVERSPQVLHCRRHQGAGRRP